MSRQKQSRGQCAYCKKEMTKGGLAKHLATCEQRQQAIGKANKAAGATQTLYHLQVQDAWGGNYWLHLEMNGSATLEKLDHYLRAIWLECCGHMSSFSFEAWSGNDISMQRKAQQIFEPGMELIHIYDFGTSSETAIKVIAAREGKPRKTGHPIALMGRNNPPEFTCMECDRQATLLCMECMYEADEPGFLCDEHADDHPHEDYGEPVEIVNSPRLGMCGYTGPAEPPY